MLTALLIAATADFITAVRTQDLKQVETFLQRNPSLASSRDDKGNSAVAIALAARRKEGFVPIRENRVLAALLRRKPALSDFDTCSVGTADQVRALIAKDPKFVASRSQPGWTPLHHASFADNAGAAAVLLDAGAEIDARAQNRFSNTPLQVALLTSSAQVAKLLIDRGADVNAEQAEGITALHEAAQSGDAGIVEMLLAAGARRDAPSRFGTPLDLARKGNHEAAVKLLAGP